MGKRWKPWIAAGLASGLACGAAAQAPDTAALVAAQREAMKPLAAMNGVWRGPATFVTPNGAASTITQTERIGPFLDGTLKVIEGRGYDAGGNVVFNALGIVSYDPATRAYTLRSYKGGLRGDFPLKPTDEGYVWEVPAGPGAIVRYTATIRGDRLHEVGHRIVAGAAPARVFEMTLTRVGDTAWPAGDAVPPR